MNTGPAQPRPLHCPACNQEITIRDGQDGGHTLYVTCLASLGGCGQGWHVWRDGTLHHLPEQTARQVFYTRLPCPLVAWVHAEAARQRTTMSALIEKAVEEYRARRGVCAVCGEAMELTAEDLADPASAVCVECVG